MESFIGNMGNIALSQKYRNMGTLHLFAK